MNMFTTTNCLIVNSDFDPANVKHGKEIKKFLFFQNRVVKISKKKQLILIKFKIRIVTKITNHFFKRKLQQESNENDK